MKSKPDIDGSVWDYEQWGGGRGVGSDPRWWCKIRKITGVWIICQCVYATILGKWCYCSISGGHRTTESSGGSGGKQVSRVTFA